MTTRVEYAWYVFKVIFIVWNTGIHKGRVAICWLERFFVVFCKRALYEYIRDVWRRDEAIHRVCYWHRESWWLATVRARSGPLPSNEYTLIHTRTVMMQITLCTDARMACSECVYVCGFVYVEIFGWMTMTVGETEDVTEKASECRACKEKE